MGNHDEDTPLTTAEAGRRGGRRTLERLGVEHYRQIGRLGAQARLASQSPEERRAVSSRGGIATRDRFGREHYREIARKGGNTTARGFREGNR